jgi:exopolyphosphatase/pppGpp-phosphohydrolase
VKNADFSGMQPWESEYIADLCLHHRAGNGPAVVTRNKKQARKKPKKAVTVDSLQDLAPAAFPPLLAILRLADALDRGHRAYAHITSVRITSSTVSLTLTTDESLDLELLRVEQKKELFEKVFGRKLVVRVRSKKP